MLCLSPKMRHMKVHFLIGLFILISIYMVLFYLMIEIWYERKYVISTKSLVLPHVVVHIDLKGTPPKLGYLESLLPTFHERGVTGLLMEYEDMFPYHGALRNISARNCYGAVELKHFLQKAADYKIEIIPLVQTFGHMEHVLKIEEFMHLREEPAFPDSICPSRDESRDTIKLMLEQVIDFHKSVASLNHIHIGCDEVFHLKKCDLCNKNTMNNMSIFAEHVLLLSNYLKTKIPETSVLIWDDMLRKFTSPVWSKISLAENIQPVYWDYVPKPQVSHVNLLQYHRVFRQTWIASAYKGADGKEATLPNLFQRYQNNYNWLRFINGYKFGGENQIHHFRGIILTGWSRYSHLDAPCELLPAAMPSLMLNLILIQTFKNSKVVCDAANKGPEDFLENIDEAFFSALECSRPGNIKTGVLTDCQFASSDLYNVLRQYDVLKNHISDKFRDSLYSVEYQLSERFMNPNLVSEYVIWCEQTLNALDNFELVMGHYMKKYYEKNFIVEYLSFKTSGIRRSLKNMLKSLKTYSHKRVWERNPLK